LNSFWAKTTIFFLFIVSSICCSGLKELPSEKSLLVKNEILTTDKNKKTQHLYRYLIQKPNSSVLGIPVKLYAYQLFGEKKSDSIYTKQYLNFIEKHKFWTNFWSKKQIHRYYQRKKALNWKLTKFSERPVWLKESAIEKSQKNLRDYFWNQGYFNAETEAKITIDHNKNASVTYKVKPKSPYLLGKLDTQISSKLIDSIYQKNKSKTLLKSGERFITSNLEKERFRITKNMRNQGIYDFQKEYIQFIADTLEGDHKNHLTLRISEPSTPVEFFTDSKSDTTKYNNNLFKLTYIDTVKIYVNTPTKVKTKYTDTLNFKGYQFFSKGKLKYAPKSIINNLFIKPKQIYSDSLRSLTYKAINSLGVFKYPNIQYLKKNYTSTIKNHNHQNLEVSMILNPRKKYAFGIDFDVSTSNIQDIGIGFGGFLKIRNAFRHTEIFELSGYSNFGASSNIEDTQSFFNISDFGIDAKLTFPRILLPFGLHQWFKKSNTPKTNMTIGINSQKNIGLDKESVVSAVNYQWKPKKNQTHQIGLLDLRYVRNLRTQNYFNVYTNAYTTTNNISKQTLGVQENLLTEDGNLKKTDGSVLQFIDHALTGQYGSQINAINTNKLQIIRERRNRLTENNLILSTYYRFLKDTRTNLYDQDFYRFKLKLQNAGFLPNIFAKWNNEELNTNGVYELFGVEYSQFLKLETEYIKHWKIDTKNTFACRGFIGLAIPYGNSKNIPFSESYFAGGSNDIRAWTSYKLGPGVSGSANEFNEANFKLLFNFEHRFKLFGALYGAWFIDGGNIWNVLDSFNEDESVRFNEWKDLKSIAIGAGTALRYDFDFFVLRFDAAWPVHDPDKNRTHNWFDDLNFSKTVLNVGINYPF